VGDVLNRGTRDRPRWYCRYVDTDGRRKQKATHQPTKQEAERFLAAIEARIARGEVGIIEPTPEERSRKSITVRELLQRFLGEIEGVDSYAPPKIKDLDRYRRSARSVFKLWILPSVGERAAASVTTADVERLRDAQLARKSAAGRAVQTLAALSRLYTWGAKVGAIGCANPVKGCERPRTAESIDYLDAAEVGRLLAQAQAAGPFMHAMIATAIFTGMRKGELFGLRWPDVQIDAARVDVNRSYRTTPKSGKPRHVPINPALAPILRAWRSCCPATVEGLVFPVEAEPGRFRMGDHADMLGIVDLLVVAGCHVPEMPWHALRHTFASHFMMRGGNILTLQKLLGHADLKTTMRYAHLAPDFLAAEVARLDFPAPPPAEVTDLAAERRRRAGDTTSSAVANAAS